jgi:hypothetical protein
MLSHVQALLDIELDAVAYVDVGEEWEDDEDESDDQMPQVVEALIAGMVSALFGERDQVTAASEASWRLLDKEARWVTAVTVFETVWTRLVPALILQAKQQADGTCK